MARLIFEKTGNAVWMSHLDLMRLFQRAFKRAGLALTHTHGFNPRPSVSIALPLSVGMESRCELLDLSLNESDVDFPEIQERLNAALIPGVHVHQVYDKGRKIGELSLLRCEIYMHYHAGFSDTACQMIEDLFHSKELLVPKKTKNGIQEQNIITMIRELDVAATDRHVITLNCLICCQNPTLNPAQIPLSIEKYLPEMKPDFYSCRRLEVYDDNKTVFR